jgi:hypothetical protein
MANRRWGKDIKRAQVRNHRRGKPAKIEVRRRVLEAIGRDGKVFDAFAGAGEMYREVWNEAAHYVGCDTEWTRDGRLAYVCDNRRVMRSIDLGAFSIFDFDAFGSPWEQLLILAARRPVKPGERIGIVMTDGTSLKLKQGGLPNALAVAAGLHGKLSGLHRWQADIVTRGIAGIATRIGCQIERRWQAEGKSAAKVLYIGVVLCGEPVQDRQGTPVARQTEPEMV